MYIARPQQRTRGGRICGACVLVASLAYGGSAQAAEYYVAKTGHDGNPGTISAPFLTITKGVSGLRPGDTLWVRTGIYNETLFYNIPSGTSWSATVRIAAYSGEAVTIRPSTTCLRVLGFAGHQNGGTLGEQKYIEFDGINVDATNCTDDAIKIEEGPGYSAHHIRFKNLAITHHVFEPSRPCGQAVLGVGMRSDAIGSNEFQNVRVSGGGPVAVGADFCSMFYFNSPNNLIENSIIENGIGAGVQIYNGHAGGSVPSNQTIRNNVFRNFTNAPLTRGDGIVVAGGSGHRIYNNLIYNLNFTGNVSAGILLQYGSGAEVFNNTIVDQGAFGIYVTAEFRGAVITNNILYRNGTNYLNLSTGTIASNNLVGTDPGFVDLANHSFSLRSNSPAVDAGVSLSLVTNDLQGTPRPQGAGYDIGAFEHSNSTGALSAPVGVKLLPN